MTTNDRYLVCMHWGHCFKGSHESIVRFAYDRATDTLYAQLQKDGWQSLAGAMLADLRDDLVDNDVLTHPEQWEEVMPMATRPHWEEGRPVCGRVRLR